MDESHVEPVMQEGTAEKETTEPGHQDTTPVADEGDETEDDPVSKMRRALKLREESKAKPTAAKKDNQSSDQLGAKPKATCAIKRPASSKMVTAKAKAKCAMKVAKKDHVKQAGYIVWCKRDSSQPFLKGF